MIFSMEEATLIDCFGNIKKVEKVLKMPPKEREKYITNNIQKEFCNKINLDMSIKKIIKIMQSIINESKSNQKQKQNTASDFIKNRNK